MAGPTPRSTACPVCDGNELRATVELRGVPTQDGVLWHSEREARESPLGDIRLVLCERCSFVWNELHDPGLVGFRGYDVSLQHSPAFRSFVAGLADRLIAAHGLHDKTVLDIGCGRGHFLEEICRRGPNVGIGIDPSIETRRVESPALTLHGEPYGQEHTGLHADLVSCRHVLDILGEQTPLVQLLGVALEHGSPGAVVYVEVPNAMATFRELVVWNLVYEHRAWFVAGSLRYLFERAGFDVTRVEPCWHDEYLGLEAHRPRQGPATPVSAAESGVAGVLDRFAASFETVRRSWQERLDALRAGGRRAVVWGAGARAIAFLSLLDADGVVPYLVDVNPKRQGLYLPRTAHRIEPPGHLLDDPPELVVVSNPTYLAEIEAQAQELGVAAELTSL